MPETPKRKKIAILGGGMGSLTSAFELTNQPDWNARYDITVYQLGWRLGGKGTSGRNTTIQHPYHEPNYRIEEHGLHIFFGFYENAFRLMKQCYDELGYNGPFMTVEDAFKPHNFIVLEEYINNRWVHWPIDFPKNSLLPWEGKVLSSLWEPVYMTIQFMYKLFIEESPYEKSQLLDRPLAGYQPTSTWWERLAKQLQLSVETLEVLSESALVEIPAQLGHLLQKDPLSWFDRIDSTIKQIETSLKKVDFSSEGAFLTLAHQLAQSISVAPQNQRREHHRTIIKLLEKFMTRLRHQLENAIEQDDETYKRLILLDFAYANIRGLLADGVIFEGHLDSLDEYDYKDWLQKHGAKQATLDSSLVRVLYDLVYAFKDGDIQQPKLAAGIAIRIIINVVFKYSGAIMWKMQAGMGDTIFAPLYKVLQRRGVKFKFFHRVQQLHLSEDQKSIASISMGRQVNLQDDQEYDPLIEVKRLLCWPSLPRYEQIVEGEKLQEQKINLESFWTPWQDVEEFSLKAGEDFDLVVLGISLAALPFICSELIQANRKWADMVEQVKTVTTQGGQLWLKSDLRQLGWKWPSPVLSSYVEPLDTYSDMTQVLHRENWPSEHFPYSIAYLTGVMADPGIPLSSDHSFPERVKEQLEGQAINFLQNHIGYLWPKATTPENPQGLDWQLLVDPENRQGEARFYSQYWIANINPSERYVMSVPGSTKYRLKTDESGFENLYLTGDWINNGFNSGCIEATVMSGMQTVRAILKQKFQIEYSKEILGEWDSWS